MAYYRYVTCDLIVQPAFVVCILNCAWEVTIETEAVTAVVDPISKVELSVYCVVVPFHTAITSPVLAFEALVTVYKYFAPVNDPVAWLNTVLAPAADGVIVFVVILLIPTVSGPVRTVEPVTSRDPVRINVSTFELNTVPVLPDTVNDPVITTFWFSGFTKEAVEAKELETVLEELTAKDAEIILFEPNGPYTFEAVTKEAVAAVVATGAQEADTAHEEVPNNEPVIIPSTFNDPEIVTVLVEKSPPIKGVPEPEAIYNLLLSTVVDAGPASFPIRILLDEFPSRKNPAKCPKTVLKLPVSKEPRVECPKVTLLKP